MRGTTLLPGLILPCALLLTGCGGDTASSTAAATGPPVLVAGPAPRVVPVGSTWTFTVSATGSGLAYQWRKGGQALPGATANSFAFTPTSTQEGGSLDVVVSNGAGSVNSAAVDVKVVTAQGPWNQDLKLCVGATADAFGPATTFVAQAGVVSLAKRQNGQLIAVFQWFPFAEPAAFDLVAACFSSDGGRTWTAPKTLTVTGLPAGFQRPFDPTITLREDGNLRLYFTSSEAGSNPMNGFRSATSTDGLNYVVEEGPRFYPGRSTVDCAAIRWNGQWHLTSPIGSPQEGAYHAVSPDGLTFTRIADIPSVNNANWTGNLVGVGSALRFYGSGSTLWYASTTNGGSWSVPTSLGIQGGDPAVVEAEPARWLLAFTAPKGN